MHKLLNAFLLTISISAFAQESTAPKIHGADIYGAKPNRPFLYKIPATGAKPMEYGVIGLPQGLTLDKNTGIISGISPAKNNYSTQLIAKNNFGADTLTFDIKVGEELSLTPAMGWNSWNCFASSVFPTPVGPENKKLPIGFSGLPRPARESLIADAK